ncbi:MAG: hypothetical protein C4575_12885 [Desulforudis sp.]|jgi:hypothetical protein|nr:MAG: hypothetical protein C4575_12885 [Desulforudis sp.]
MPYSGINDETLPDQVKEMPEKVRTAWIKTFNSMHEKCMAEKGEDCEGKAMAGANAVAKRMMDSDGGEMEGELQLAPVELSNDALTEGRLFDGLAAGEFIDMLGRKAAFKAAELGEFLKNTLAAIEATRAESGEIVGLPIDARGHERGDAAGWIVGAELEGERIRLKPRWTVIGVELISKSIQRGFSATVDLTNKVILGGTLTNWPATRNKSGHILLRPVELSRNGLSNEEEANMPDNVVAVDMGQLQKLVETAVAAAMPKPPVQTGNGNTDVELESLVAEFGGLSDEAKKARKEELRRLSEYVRKQAELEFQAEMQRERHESRMAELAQTLVGGSDAAPRGYQATVDEVKAHLLKMAPDEAKFWGEFLSKTQKDGFVEFDEVGHGREPQGTKPLPSEFAEQLDAGTIKLADLSDPAAGLGDLRQYDLSKWSGGVK